MAAGRTDEGGLTVCSDHHIVIDRTLMKAVAHHCTFRNYDADCTGKKQINRHLVSAAFTAGDFIRTVSAVDAPRQLVSFHNYGRTGWGLVAGTEVSAAGQAKSDNDRCGESEMRRRVDFHSDAHEV